MAKGYWKLKIIKKTKTHITVDVTPMFKGKKNIPKYIRINPENIELI